jgi:hypothetical protein
MKIFYDTEFIEDGKTIDLISIGMVAEDGRELYAVAEEIEEEPLYGRICKHEWLMGNVVPHLPLKAATDYWQPFEPPSSARGDKGRFDLDPNDNRIMPRRMLRNAVREFVTESARFGQVELWADYGAYDHVVLAQLFGRMLNLPAGFPMYTHDLRQEIDRRGAGAADLPAQDAATAHDALADARWVRDTYDALYPF